MSYWVNTNINKWSTQLYTGALLCKDIVQITRIRLQKYSRLPITRGWVGYSDTQHKYIHAYINKILFYIIHKYAYQH
jgi:hypothetical protein